MRRGAKSGVGDAKSEVRGKGQKWKEAVILVLQYFIMILIAGELLYGDFRLGIIFSPVFPVYWVRQQKKKREEESFQRILQFRDAINSIGASLEAGYSMENAVHATQKDLACLYPGESWIRQGMAKIARSVENGIPLEEALRNFAVSSKLEDAESFAAIYATARKSGGDLLQIIRAAVSVISDKIEVRREIYTILTAKQLECRVMRLIPPGILVYFRVFSPSFLDFLYQGVFGKALMSGLFCFYLFLAWAMERMVKIEV